MIHEFVVMPTKGMRQDERPTTPYRSRSRSMRRASASSTAALRRLNSTRSTTISSETRLQTLTVVWQFVVALQAGGGLRAQRAMMNRTYDLARAKARALAAAGHKRPSHPSPPTLAPKPATLQGSGMARYSISGGLNCRLEAGGAWDRAFAALLGDLRQEPSSGVRSAMRVRR